MNRGASAVLPIGPGRLRARVRTLLESWWGRGDLFRPELVAAARELTAWRRSRGIAGMWPEPPLMLTATLDDAWGHGLDLIQLYSAAVGLRVHPLGLRVDAAAILAACAAHRPDIVGLTVLQTGSLVALGRVVRGVPPRTAVWVGGRIFDLDPGLVRESGIDQAVSGVPRFLQLLLQWPAAGRRTSNSER